MNYLDRPAPRKGPPWAHNSLGASVHNALAGWWRLPRAQRTVGAAGGLLEQGWINEGFASDAQSAAVRSRAASMVEAYVARLDPAAEPAGVERTVAARTERIAVSGRIDRLDDRPRPGRAAGSWSWSTTRPAGGRSAPTTRAARCRWRCTRVAAARVLRRPCHQVELHHLPTGTVHAWDAHRGHAGPAAGPGRGHRRRVRGRRRRVPRRAARPGRRGPGVPAQSRARPAAGVTSARCARRDPRPRPAHRPWDGLDLPAED